jgi:hypothetical protein
MTDAELENGEKAIDDDRQSTRPDTEEDDGSGPPVKSKYETADLERGGTAQDAADNEKVEEEPRDPNIVDYDGPDDPDNPYDCPSISNPKRY